jgi:hypothetical protein
MEPNNSPRRLSIFDQIEDRINRSDTNMCNLLNYIDTEIDKRKRLSEVSNDPSYYHGMVMALLNIQEFILKNK